MNQTKPISSIAPVDATKAELQQMVDIEKSKREIIKQYVKEQLVEGIDFGKIPIGGRESKTTLFKPGMEKILSLMGITTVLEKDADTWEMLGSKSGVICYRCTLSKGTQILSEGRGSATVGDKGRDANATIKIAEKRARMDATLTLGFSEFFTQDLEDMTQPEVLGAATKSYEAREDGSLPDGEYEVVITDERTGAKDGKEWQRVKTGDGAAWNNSGVSMEIGQQYQVTIVSGSIKSARIVSDDFDDIEDYMPN